MILSSVVVVPVGRVKMALLYLVKTYIPIPAPAEPILLYLCDVVTSRCDFQRDERFQDRFKGLLYIYLLSFRNIK